MSEDLRHKYDRLSTSYTSRYADPDAIYVVRREPHLLRIRFRFRDLSGPEAISARFQLHDGDVLVVE